MSHDRDFYVPPSRSPLTRLLFPAVDDNLLKYNYDDNQRVEPEWYIPIIPTVLVNGADGIGTGWASRLPNYDVREIINNLHRLLNGEEPLPMVRRKGDERGARGGGLGKGLGQGRSSLMLIDFIALPCRNTLNCIA